MTDAHAVSPSEPMVETSGVRSLPLADGWLRKALVLGEGETPFPWQRRLMRHLLESRGDVPRALDIPTGLGKTAVMAIWLVARACGAQVPRRLAYVVDRRAVVDQASEVALQLREIVETEPSFKEGLGLSRPLPVSTLRGKHVDNREWLGDPSSVAIVVGTVDMVGSRLLFEGYRTSRKMRPYHAGLLGVDTLVVLDEAHLVPAFEKLLDAFADSDAYGPRDDTDRALLPRFKMMALSATRRGASGAFTLDADDLAHQVVEQRLTASKRLSVRDLSKDEKLEDALAEAAWEVCGRGAMACRCIVFSHSRDVAVKAKEKLDRLARQEERPAPVSQLLVGGRRVLEREGVADWLRARGFMAGTRAARDAPAFVFATAAGEVGVDLDADHAVMDLVAWERMVQRLGRVNRRGEGDAIVRVVGDRPKPRKAAQSALEKRARGEDLEKKEQDAITKCEAEEVGRLAQRQLLDRLPALDEFKKASAEAIGALTTQAREDYDLKQLIEKASTPEPLRPELTRALVDAWSMTSLLVHPGRPEDITPWLRGWIDDDGPQTAVVWRRQMPVRTRGGQREPFRRKEIEAFFEAAPPHASEVLEAETYRVIDWLKKRAEAIAKVKTLSCEGLVAVVLSPAGDWRRSVSVRDLEDLRDKDKRDHQGEFFRQLSAATLVVDARVAGLSDGLLDAKHTEVARTADDDEPWLPSEQPVVRFRVRRALSGASAAREKGWRERARFPVEVSGEGEAAEWLVIDKYRDDATEEDRSAGPAQLLDQHEEWAEEDAGAIADRLRLPEPMARALRLAARLHDEGKRARRWQRAFCAPRDGGDYAKTPGPIRQSILDGYRHELGSLLRALGDDRVRALPGETRDLVLHLIAAHHGFARPVLPTRSCDDAPPSALEEVSREVALRFARLQRRWGPWGLAWLESLLRAADSQASERNDRRDDR